MTEHSVYVTSVARRQTPARFGAYADGVRILVGEPTVYRASTQTVAGDLLEMLDTDHRVSGAGKHPSDNLLHALMLLTAHETEWMVLTSPHHIPAQHLTTFVQAALISGARLLLVCEPGTEAQVIESTAAWMPCTVPVAEAKQWLGTPQQAPPEREDEPKADEDIDEYPTVPCVDFYRFQRVCRETLTPEQMANIDTAYVGARAAARNLAGAGHLTLPKIDALVDDLASRHPDRNIGVAILRGMQAGLFAEGWHAAHVLRMGIHALGDLRPHMGTAEWRRFGAFKDPVRAAIPGLYLSGFEVKDILDMTVADIAPTLTGPPNIAGHEIAAEAIPYLGAQYLRRIFDDAEPGDSFITYVMRHTVTRLLREVSEDTNLRLGATRIEAGSASAHFEASRYGYTLTRLKKK